MEIISKIVELKAVFPIENAYIESELKKLGFAPLRWAIVKVDENTLTISFAFENL